MEKLNVGVIFGGFSSEHDVSKKSAMTILFNMSKEKYNIIPIYIDKQGKWFLYDGSLDNIKNFNWGKFGTNVSLSCDRNKKSLIRIVGDKISYIPIDVIFPVLHGKNGEDGTIQGMLEICNIPYVGCSLLSSAICMDKSITKVIVKNISGVKQAPYLTFTENDLEEIDEVCKKIRYKIGYPCFIKPARGGSSVGISRCENKQEFKENVQIALKEDNKIVVEKCINMRELECAVLGTGDKDTIVSRVGEIKAADIFYDFDAKYNNPESKTIVPAQISKEIEENIREQALKIYKALGCKGLSRVDFFLDLDKNEVIFNEINTMPGFTEISMYPMLLGYEGIDISEVIDRLIKIAYDK